MSPNSASGYIDEPHLPTCSLEVLIQTKYVQEITCIAMQASSLFSFSPHIHIQRLRCCDNGHVLVTLYTSSILRFMDGCD